MENREKLDKMEKALRLLEDLINSQEALVEKSLNLQTEAMSYNFPELEKVTGELTSMYNGALETLNEALDRFGEKRDIFQKQHNLDNPEL